MSTKSELMLKVQVRHSLANIAVECLPSQEAIIRSLNLNRLIIRDLTAPSGKNITAEKLVIRSAEEPFKASKDVAFYRPFIPALRAIDAKSRSAESGAIFTIASVGQHHLVTIEVFAGYAITRVRT